MQSLLRYCGFVDGSIDPQFAFSATYNPTLVLLSAVIASLAAYAALSIAERMSETDVSANRRTWLWAGAVTMGVGVWAMHFLGMLAFRLPVAVRYDVLLTILSVVPAILASALMLHLVSQATIAPRQLALGGTFMGAGIGAMHYTGMAAVRANTVMLYDPLLFGVSVIVAVVLAIFALYTKFLVSRRAGHVRPLWTKLGTAPLMGLAVTGMHYTGMAAAYFFPGTGLEEVGAVVDTTSLGIWVTLAAVLITVAAICITMVDRRLETAATSERASRQHAEVLTKLVQQVEQSGIQVMTSATQLAASGKQLESMMAEQVTSTQEVGATAKEIAATSQELVQTMREVTGVSEDTATAAVSGQSGLARMEATMENMEVAARAIATKLATIQERAADITTVVTTITKVADQTNLLSLNASIEAEKAGEYGRGFAVVAREIRRLADQSAVATLDIERIVDEMRAAVSEGVLSMEQFTHEVHQDAEEVRAVGTQLVQIIDQVQTLTPRFETVNVGMEAQAQGAQQISVAMEQLSEASQQTANTLYDSTRAIEQLNDAAQSLRHEIAHVNGQPQTSAEVP
jgi:methyl-accepting chemotaxis protein WspA